MMRDMLFDEIVNTYLDGELEGAELAEFESRLEREAELRETVDRLRRIQVGLRAIEPEAVDVPDPREMLERARPGRNRQLFKLAAAVLLLVGAVSVYAVQWLFPGGPQRSVADSFVYESVTADFEPATICDTHEKFLAYTIEALGEPIAADFDSASTSGVVLVGWDVFGGRYRGPEKDTLPRVLLAEAPGGERVVVYFEGSGHAELRDEPEGVRVESKRLGGVTAHEISRLDTPVVLDLLSVER